MASTIGDRTRKLLWSHSDRCAFPGCEQSLVSAGRDGRATTVVGVECHIVAQRDHDSVARAPCLLTDDERQRHAALIGDRHAAANLVLMCGTHSTLIDDPRQGFSVDDVLDMKRTHEESIRRERDLGRRAISGELPLVTDFAQMLGPLLDDVGAWEHQAMSDLVKSDPGAAVWLIEQLGTPEDVDRLERLVQVWPDRIAHGPHELRVAVVRKAERHKRYDLGAIAWERMADREADSTRQADFLARAAIDAGVAGDASREEALLSRSEASDPNGARARVQRVDSDDSPDRILSALKDVRSHDPKLQALIDCRRALAHMRAVDLAAAEESLRTASQLDPDSLNVRGAWVCLRVQRARIGVRDDDEYSLGEVRAAKAEALLVRNELLSLGRYSESVRLLMLAADADAVERDSEKAAETLSLATPEEIASPDGPEVLGDAALRAMDPELAIRFVEGGNEPFARRVRATARLAQRGPIREAALNELEALAMTGGPEGEQAAASRLLACFDGAPFHKPSASVLEAGEHARIAHITRAYTAARRSDFRSAETLIDQFKNTRWGAETALRLAQMRGAHERLRETARTVLRVGADPFGRYEAGLGLARAHEFDEATSVLGSVARSPNAPERLRSDAYNKLLRLCADRGAWEEAPAAWTEWRDMLRSARRNDGRLSAWQVPVVRRFGNFAA